MIIKMILFMYYNININECYTIPPENDVMYCYKESIKDYTTDYLLELYLVNYFKNK